MLSGGNSQPLQSEWISKVDEVENFYLKKQTAGRQFSSKESGGIVEFNDRSGVLFGTVYD